MATFVETVTQSNGFISEWHYKDGVFHRDEFPAVIRYDENEMTVTKYWYQNGKLSRPGGLPYIEIWKNDVVIKKIWDNSNSIKYIKYFDLGDEMERKYNKNYAYSNNLPQKEYYFQIDGGTRKRVWRDSPFDPPRKNGKPDIEEFYENGAIRKAFWWKNKAGEVYAQLFHKNGKLKTEIFGKPWRRKIFYDENGDVVNDICKQCGIIIENTDPEEIDYKKKYEDLLKSVKATVSFN